jgi:PilZ domain
MEERRNSIRRDLELDIEMESGSVLLRGTIYNISDDGAMVRLAPDAALGDDLVGAPFRLRPVDDARGAELPHECKLVRIFDTGADRFVALFFLERAGC